MKPVTKERILKALKKVEDYLDTKPEIDIVKNLAEIGIRSACGDLKPVKDNNYLELAYLGFNDPNKVFPRLSHLKVQANLSSREALKEAWMSSFERTLEKKDARCQKILNIQKAHQISGLDLRTNCLGEKVIEYHVPSWQLELLDSDRSVMYDERLKIARTFLNAVRNLSLHNILRQKVTLWVRAKGEEDDWLPTDGKIVLAHSLAGMWCKCWQHRYFVDQHELKTKGHTPLKKDYDSHHDEMYWELNLVTGCGLDPDFDTDAMWFCASLGDKKPSL